MNIKQIHDFCYRRIVAMFVITTIWGWICIGLATLFEQSLRVEFVLPPSTVGQAGFGIFVAGFVTIVFIPIYWVQMKLIGHVTKRLDYVRTLSVTNAYVFVIAIILFASGFVAGQIVPPVFMVTPGVYLSLWLFKMLSR